PLGKGSARGAIWAVGRGAGDIKLPERCRQPCKVLDQSPYRGPLAFNSRILAWNLSLNAITRSGRGVARVPTRRRLVWLLCCINRRRSSPCFILTRRWGTIGCRRRSVRPSLHPNLYTTRQPGFPRRGLRG